MRVSTLVIVGFLLSNLLSAADHSKMTIDHASFCGHDLATLQRQFSAVGMPSAYGGAHADATHMALVGFVDGSYLELIAPQHANAPIPERQKWRDAMAGDTGPCAWATEVSDVRAEIKRLKSIGFLVAGPIPGRRAKPDGTVLQWETGMLIPGDPGSTLPFFIQDLSPRALRVQPSPGMMTSTLTGVAFVVIGVRDLGLAITSFRHAYGWRAPMMANEEDFGARLAYFEDTPVILATPLSQNNWLYQRIDKYGDKPAAILLRAKDFGAATNQFPLITITHWFGQRLGWFSPTDLGGMRLGVLGN